MAQQDESAADFGRTAAPSANGGRSGGVLQIAAWAGIATCIVFIAAVVFFSGFFMGGYYSGHGSWHECQRSGTGQMMGPGPMMGPDGHGGSSMAPAVPAPRP
ncbi:hypothetical protein PP633_15565 [Mycobacteroides abscessus]|uniref:hypothetical protein n=1 Tax=Mycobacteroides abscessus TaxID=36809 RepID=UPI0009CD144B|nr:hypothetical protein [Mycobacteroides abscessus]MDM2645373.1 hypothetical protein [Mycobacteroides abscessus]MDM2654562.1 hypothetical protein [Mycobacteroides abscessus]MDM2663955.1 hypothetical protein [Mycobacteroides abscessus]MDM2669003.1 hypothetical protein [Mycobacteroides abscessus]MDM2672176.1 hypothetical protein [Mycobacteroides abscessus]